MSDEHARFAHDDAAYVLGALAPADTDAFEEHLRRCATCRRSVADLSTVPDALAQVPLDVVTSLDPDLLEGDAVPSPPDTILDGVLRRSRETRVAPVRRRRWTRAVVTAGAAALAAAAAALVLVLVPREPATPPPAQEAVAMTEIRPSPMTVDVTLTSVPWGTRLAITCSYEQESGGWASQESSYALVITDDTGAQEQVATWRAVPGRTVTVDAATAVPLGAIAELDVRAGDGSILLQGQS